VPIFSLLLSLAAFATGFNHLGLWALLPAVIDPSTWLLVLWSPYLAYCFWTGKHQASETANEPCNHSAQEMEQKESKETKND
jgi:hypothetical protein